MHGDKIEKHSLKCFHFFHFITAILIIVTMTNLLHSSCVMWNKILSSEVLL